MKVNLAFKDEQEAAKYSTILNHFNQCYLEAASHSGISKNEIEKLLTQLADLINKNLKDPYKFDIYHQGMQAPFNHYKFGLDLIRPLINFTESKVIGIENIDRMIDQIKQKENVILLANHQIEPDPQIIKLLLEKNYSEFVSNIIFVAGHRVIEDPIAIPMSLGCNLLCIYSKKHIDTPPEDKTKKIEHNQRTLKKMTNLLSEGGKCIYVAPSGGRDRMDKQGTINPAPFDPQSVELFWLLTQAAGHTTHFYPLSLRTYDIMPPPKSVQKELGETREAFYKPVYMTFGNEIDMKNIPMKDGLNKKEMRVERANYIWNIVVSNYNAMGQ